MTGADVLRLAEFAVRRTAPTGETFSAEREGAGWLLSLGGRSMWAADRADDILEAAAVLRVALVIGGDL